MKKLILFQMLGIMICMTAHASDGLYVQDETYTVRESLRAETVSYYDDAYIAPQRVAIKQAKKCAPVASSINVRPCDVRSAHAVGTPIRVKTYSEVIDHYQVYQPVVQYVPAGTYSQRRIFQASQPTCKKCRDM